VWLWVFCVCTGLACVLGWFFGLGCFLGFVSLWCEGYCVHKHVDFAGCGCVSMLSFFDSKGCGVCSHRVFCLGFRRGFMAKLILSWA